MRRRKFITLIGAFFAAPLGSKRLELLHAFVPKAMTIAVLVNPEVAPSRTDGANVRAAAQSVGLQAHLINASAEGQIEDAFKVTVERRIDALLVTADAFARTGNPAPIAVAEFETASLGQRLHSSNSCDHGSA